jgi:hypothetical protein
MSTPVRPLAPVGLYRVARDQRLVVLGAGAFLGCIVLALVGVGLVDVIGEPASRALGLIAENGMAFAIIVGFVGTVLLTDGLGYRAVDRVVLALLALVPLLGLFILLHTNAAAVRRLRAAGVGVGLAGVPWVRVAELHRRAQGESDGPFAAGTLPA